MGGAQERVILWGKVLRSVWETEGRFGPVRWPVDALSGTQSCL